MNKIILLIMFVLNNAEMLSAGTNFRGTARGIFVNYSGGSHQLGVGTNSYSYGYPTPNRVSFFGKQFNVTTESGYIFGVPAQNNRPTFSLGTIEYYNGDTSDGRASIQLDIEVHFTSPVATSAKTISSKLNFLVTPYNDDKYLSADYLYLPKSIRPETLLTQGGAPITIEPFGFATTDVSGFTTIDEFHVFEGEFASAELLAHITSSCEPIVNGAVKRWIGDHINPDNTIAKNTAMNATFIPKFNLSLDEAAKLCGYDHFNWVQYVIDDPRPTMAGANNPQKVLKSPFLDPPIGGYTTLIDDSLPYYWGENGPTAHELQKYSSKTKLEFYDAPGDPNLQDKDTVKFIIGLVGVLANDKYDMLYVWEWKSNYNGHTGTAQFKNISYLSPGGTGGVSITKVDLTAEEIPLNVRQMMQKDGARNVETYTDLLPVPLLIPVLFD
ncbi:MAG TPA: hypothetical protein EYG74_02495 [Sulfurimonas autotrophica]|nr:hypothetical protein [Sulfurimonas autotrophica]